VLRRFVIASLLVFVLGCGSSEPAAQGEVTPVMSIARAELTEDAEPKKVPPVKKALASADVLAKTGDLDPGDLAIIFMNNVDGEIEPCG